MNAPSQNIGRQTSDDSALVSVIIPSYNAGPFIAAALDSALRQTYRHLEVLVIDDGSIDDTVPIVRRYMERDPRVRLIRQANAGVATARNRGIAEARGAFIAPLDADDFWHEDKIRQQVAAIERLGATAGMAYTWSVIVDRQGWQVDLGTRARHEGWVLPMMVYRNFVGCASNALFRRGALVAAGMYDATLQHRNAQGCEDYKLNLQVAASWQVACVPQYLTAYRRLPGSMSADTDRMCRSFELVMAETRAQHPELPERIFRWSRASLYWWLGFKCARAGDVVGAASLTGRVLGNDPSFALTTEFISTARGLGARLLGRRRSPKVPAKLPAFAPAAGSSARRADWLEMRRTAYLQRLGAELGPLLRPYQPETAAPARMASEPAHLTQSAPETSASPTRALEAALVGS